MKSEQLSIIDRNSYGAVCAVVDGCLTCGDVAVEVEVLEVQGFDALCKDPHGQQGKVGIELVGQVDAGDRLLVHAGVAISRL
ncbi:MAG: HypC/HybG/HupF family hydrogenase formation chaperone [Actinomycetota bacterium]